MTVSAFERPLSTWASMPQLIDVEDWPDASRPASIAYFCGAIDAPWPPDRPWHDYHRLHLDQARTDADEFMARHLPHLLPGLKSRDQVLAEYLRMNVDPSDRYVLCVPGSDRHRLRADESGFDNLYLAGDWTDNGVNAGCIEAAVSSGLQAANAVTGRARLHRITGFIPSGLQGRGAG